MLAKVKEQDGIDDACKSKGTRWDAKVKVPSTPTSAACCNDVQQTNVESSSHTFYNRQLLNPLSPNDAIWRHTYFRHHNFMKKC